MASSLFFSSHPQHRHSDQLNLMLFAYDNALLTDIGYPEQTDAFNHRLSGYFVNTIAHNTVTVDGSKQDRRPSTLHAYSDRGFAQVVDASCDGAYPDKVSLYRMANILVEVGPEHSYVFDAFYVRGGSQHDFALHGTQAEFACSPALGPVQEKGTLAGPDVPYEQFYDDPDLKDKPIGSVSYTRYRGSGFQFLTNVQRAPLVGSAVGEWKLTEPLKGQPERPWKGIGLRAHLLGTDEELISCDGPVQRYAQMPKSVKCLIRRCAGENVQSRFVSVFEPYKDRTWIKQVAAVSIEPNDGNASAALVELVGGGKHYLFHSITPEQEYVLDGRVKVSGQAACLVLDKDGKPLKWMLLNGTVLRMEGFSVKGRGISATKITSVDYARGIIEIADPVLSRDIGQGAVVSVRGQGFTGCVTLRKVIDKAHFSIGEEDLRVAGGPVNEVVGREIVTTVQTPNALPGMTLLNSKLEPKGRLQKRGGSGWIVSGPPALKIDDFPRAQADTCPRFYVVMAGPGDDPLIPDCVIGERD
jgi:hypothetical protein